MTQAFQVPPGDPTGVRAAAAGFGRLASDQARLRTTFDRQVDHVLERWTGGFADRFRATAEQVATRFDPVSGAAKAAEQALGGYAAALEAAQRTVGSLNAQAARLASDHSLNIAARSTAMAQLDQQASDARSSLDRAAKNCARILSEAQAALGGALPDTMSVKELQSAVRAASAELKRANPGLWEKLFGPDGLLRQWDERAHALPGPAADMVLFRLLANAEVFKSDAELLAETPGLMEAEFPELVRPLMRSLSTGETTIAELAQTLRDFTHEWEPFVEFNNRFRAANLAEAARLPWLRGVAIGANALAMVGDVYILINPEDHGPMRQVDRGVAAANLALTGLDTGMEIAGYFGVEASLGPVGMVAIVGTGLYLGGDWLYHHWKPFHDVCNDIGHAVVSVAKDAWHDVTSWF